MTQLYMEKCIYSKVNKNMYVHTAQGVAFLCIMCTEMLDVEIRTERQTKATNEKKVYFEFKQSVSEFYYWRFETVCILGKLYDNYCQAWLDFVVSKDDVAFRVQPSSYKDFNVAPILCRYT